MNDSTLVSRIARLAVVVDPLAECVEVVAPALDHDISERSFTNAVMHGHRDDSGDAFVVRMFVPELDVRASAADDVVSVFS